MPQSALNQQQSRLKNYSLYFLLGLLSTGQRLEAQMTRHASNAIAEDATPDQNDDFLYLCLGLLAFSQDLQTRLKREYDRTSRHDQPPANHHADALSNALF